MKYRAIWYINIGNMTTSKAEEYINDISKKFKSTFDDFDVVYIPIRNENSRFELLPQKIEDVIPK